MRALSALEWNRGATSAGGDWLDVDRIAFDVGLVLLDVVVLPKLFSGPIQLKKGGKERESTLSLCE